MQKGFVPEGRVKMPHGYQPSLWDEAFCYSNPAFKRRATLRASRWDADAAHLPEYSRKWHQADEILAWKFPLQMTPHGTEEASVFYFALFAPF